MGIFVSDGIVHSRKVCNIYWMDTPTLTGQTAFTLYSFFLGFAIPLVLILVFYFLVIFKLSKVSHTWTIRETMVSRFQDRNTDAVGSESILSNAVPGFGSVISEGFWPLVDVS